MGRRTTVDEWDEFDEDPEFDEDADEPATFDCPYCRREIMDDTVQCPHCGNYLSAEDAPREPKSLWWAFGVVLALIACALMLFCLG